MESVVRCITCGKICTDTDRVWQVRTIDGCGNVLYSPTCSAKCAEEARSAYSDIHKKRLHDMERQTFQIMTVKSFAGDSRG